MTLASKKKKKIGTRLCWRKFISVFVPLKRDFNTFPFISGIVSKPKIQKSCEIGPKYSNGFNSVGLDLILSTKFSHNKEIISPIRAGSSHIIMIIIISCHINKIVEINASLADHFK